MTAASATGVVTGEGLLFLHGAGGRGLVWQQQLLAFPWAAAPDLPRGAEGGPAAAGGAATAGVRRGVDGYLAAVRARVGPAPGSPRIVAGHSLGGAIALTWALTYPDEVRALILVGTGARLRVAPELLEGIRADVDRGLAGFVARWFAPRADPRLKEKSLELLRGLAPGALLAELEAADGFDVTADLGHLTLPALVICGAEDRVTPVDSSRDLHARIRGSELVIVEGAGHMVMLEQPRSTNAAIRRFLERLEGGLRA